MDSELYKKHIKQMIKCINNEQDLKMIYAIVHKKFIRRDLELETGKEG